MQSLGSSDLGIRHAVRGFQIFCSTEAFNFSVLQMAASILSANVKINDYRLYASKKVQSLLLAAIPL